MVFDLASHGLNGRSRLGAGVADALKDYATSAFLDVAGDKGVKARVVAEAVRAVTGQAPTVDTRDPSVTWVRLTPYHAKWAEAVLTKAVKTGPNAKPADFKLDVMPAVQPLLLKRLLPVLLVVGVGIFSVGYFMGKD